MKAEKKIICVQQSCTFFRLLRSWYTCVNVVTANWNELRLAWFGGSIKNKSVSYNVRKIPVLFQ